MTHHVWRFPLEPGKPMPVPQVGDKVTAMYDDGMSEMYVVAADPLPDGGVRLRFSPKPRHVVMDVETFIHLLNQPDAD